jgi:regulation of enolase protein 1 (concanavalin A-like superfamily)
MGMTRRRAEFSDHTPEGRCPVRSLSLPAAAINARRGLTQSTARRLVTLCLLIIAVCLPRVANAQINQPVPAVAQAVPVTPLPVPWIGQDVGHPTVSGSSIFQSDRFVIAGGGETVAGASDQFRFVYQTLAGNVQIKARIDSLAGTQGLAKAGLMIRSSLDADAAHGAVLMTANGELGFHRRQQRGAWTLTNSSGSEMSTTPQWVALQRMGSRVVAYSSPDGERWTAIGSEAVELGATAYVGIAVTGDALAPDSKAEITHVAVSGLPPWQRQENIGGPANRGSAWYTEGTYTITGGGAIGETQDQFNFVYQEMRGDLDLVARVASLSATNQNAKAGVMIRESLTAESRHAFAWVSAGTGYAFDRRDQVGGWSVHSEGGPGSAPGWLRLVRSGNNVEAFRSNDGLTWTAMGSAELAMDQQVYVGLAVASHDAATTTAVIDAVGVTPIAAVPTSTTTATVTSRATEDIGAATAIDDVSDSLTGLPNLPPVVELTSPMPGATFTAPATITLNALAIDPEGRLTSVRFFANGNPI